MIKVCCRSAWNWELKTSLKKTNEQANLKRISWALVRSTNEKACSNIWTGNWTLIFFCISVEYINCIYIVFINCLISLLGTSLWFAWWNNWLGVLGRCFYSTHLNCPCQVNKSPKISFYNQLPISQLGIDECNKPKLNQN